MKKAYLIHGWEGNPENYWFPWLKSELESRDFEVVAPEMPNSDEPKIQPWIEKLKSTLQPDENTVLVGHSIGCQTIMRYLQDLDSKLDRVIFVAPFFHLNNLEDQESKEIAKPWLETPIDLEAVKEKANSFTAIFSDNDPFVPLSDKDIFQSALGAKIIVEHDKNHFDEGINELPSALNSIIN